jgi:hypothetical protein
MAAVEASAPNAKPCEPGTKAPSARPGAIAAPLRLQTRRPWPRTRGTRGFGRWNGPRNKACSMSSRPPFRNGNDTTDRIHPGSTRQQCRPPRVVRARRARNGGEHGQGRQDPRRRGKQEGGHRRRQGVERQRFEQGCRRPRRRKQERPPQRLANDLPRQSRIGPAWNRAAAPFAFNPRTEGKGKA